MFEQAISRKEAKNDASLCAQLSTLERYQVSNEPNVRKTKRSAGRLRSHEIFEGTQPDNREILDGIRGRQSAKADLLGDE